MRCKVLSGLWIAYCCLVPAQALAQLPTQSNGNSGPPSTPGEAVHVPTVHHKKHRVPGLNVLADLEDCMGGHFELSDTGRTIRLDGVCTLLTVTGSKNVVFVRVASGASIQVTGDGNTVFWTLDDPTGAVPDVDNAGAGNSIRRG